MTTSCVDPGQIATRLPLRSFTVLISDLAFAKRSAMPQLHCAANITRGHQQAAPSVAGANSEGAEIDIPRDHGVFAVG